MAGGSVYAMQIPYEKRDRKSSNRDHNIAWNPLESAESHLTASTTAGSASHGGGSKFSASFSVFVSWCQENKLVRQESEFDFLRRRPDGWGEEHEAWFHEGSNRWRKVTYHNKFGLAWGKHETATVCEYLTRLVLQNKYFGDDIQLVALVQCGSRIRVLTSQSHVAGERAPYEEIRQWFFDLGFKCLKHDGCIAWYLKSENLLIADAHEGNVLRTVDGMLVPIDLNLIQPTGELFAWANE
jgi:hypothetical protein